MPARDHVHWRLTLNGLKIGLFWAVVVAQLVERLLPTPEVRSLNPVIGKNFNEHCLLSTVLRRRKWRKRGREWPIFKKLDFFRSKNGLIDSPQHKERLKNNWNQVFFVYLMWVKNSILRVADLAPWFCLRSWVRIPSTPSMLFSICIIEIVMRK